ncbi:hypothetical protein NQZ79_g4337 [Umbelopsis isabellina]|nr:hypothetical protein NQZ79_g4337 [Umbelopsis isabellina]
MPADRKPRRLASAPDTMTPSQISMSCDTQNLPTQFQQPVINTSDNNDYDPTEWWLSAMPSVETPSFGSADEAKLSTSTNTAEKRMAHNAMERVRRETLNTKFQELAYALPTLRTVRRPSKSQIVQRALEFVRSAFIQEKVYQKQITTLKRENELLIAQLDSIRNKLSNQMNAEVFGVPMKIGDADFVLEDNPPLQQQAEDEDDQSTESWEYDTLGLGEQASF